MHYDIRLPAFKTHLVLLVYIPKLVVAIARYPA